MNRTTALMLIAFAFCAAQLNAQDEEKKRRRQPADGDGKTVFDRLDTNSDGKVTADEVTDERRKSYFERLLKANDADSDGALSREEFDKGAARRRARQGDRPESDRRRGTDRPQRRRPGTPGRASDRDRDSSTDVLFQLLDANHDGKLSAEEIASASKRLSRFDRDKDGDVSKREIAAAASRIAASRRRGQRDGRRAGGTAASIKRLDKNGDGKISREEAPERMKQYFDRIDSDGDGNISAAEIEKSSAQRGRRRGSDGDTPRRRRRPGSDKDSGDKDSGDKDSGDKDSGDKDSGDKAKRERDT